MNLNIKKIKKDFPILKQRFNHKKFIYLDNATTLQKPKIVINKINKFLKTSYSSVNRGFYTLNNINTNKIEETRISISKFINAKSPEEIIFTKNSTEGINLLSNILSNSLIKKKDNIIITIMEHHSNFVPWYIISKKYNYLLKIIKIKKNGKLDIKNLKNLIDNKTKIISITHISNVLGVINPIKKIIKIAKKHNILTIIDGSQSISHIKINVQKIKCDFFIFSGHKMYSLNGVGIIYGKKNILKNLNPLYGGGGIISNINIKNNNIQNINFVNSPWKFEYGTPNIESIISLNYALKYINNIKLTNIIKYEKKITKYTINKLKLIPEIKIYGSKPRIGIISFNVKNHHCYDIGFLLNKYGICIRTGNQCAIPIMKFYNISGMCRLSIAIYNSKKDINTFLFYLKKIITTLK